jgi:hypothetical protein
MWEPPSATLRDPGRGGQENRERRDDELDSLPSFDDWRFGENA